VSVQRVSTEPDPRYLLSVYLRDHLAGATAGVRLAERCRRANSGSELGLTLAEIERDISDDRRSLKEMMARLGIAESKAKELIGLAVEALGRLKSNGRLVRYSPSSRVVELEALAAGIFTKRSLWLSLRAVADDYRALDRDELDRLVATATKQYQRLITEHDQAARTAFGSVLPPIEHSVDPSV
jgi:hypothetical protein